MEDNDIKRLRKVLKYKELKDLSDLLKNSRSNIRESSTYGTMWYSVISYFEIYSPIRLNEKLILLSDEDKSKLLKAILLIYPIKENEVEIVDIEFYPDFDLEEEYQLIETASLKNIDFEYIQEQIEKCNIKIVEKDFEGAVTNSRTLLESICLYIYEVKVGDYDYKGNLLKLYKDVSQCLNMGPADHSDEYLKQILSGIFSIINGVSGLRNNFSDAHGNSPRKAYKIDDRHAILTVNLSKTIAEYLYLSYKKSESKA
ncbi:MAG: abortive infection family protein [Chryseobacterium sp.]|uniref:abortive infection family protein n=1 Tax=Chryseobacterium sp. TaxID=1871047 RepID=UPI001B1DA140|nr:abortive infection family protein [Chryseobacterium sp.]MBO6186570.1 abortive infection family protein [Chryseobacterium sp.]